MKYKNIKINNQNKGAVLRDTLKLLDWELKRIADSFEDMGKDIKPEDMK
jgi:hypothetical protein